GLPMFLPRGAVIAEELEKLAKETEFAAGYQRVRTPHIARESLYLKSGHLPYYAESMFPPIGVDEYAAERKEFDTQRASICDQICRRVADIGRKQGVDEENIGTWSEKFLGEGTQLRTLPSDINELMSRHRLAN